MAAGMTTDQATAPPSPGEARTAPAPTVPRRSRRARWIALALVGPLALLIAVLATRPPASTRAADSPLVGKAAPDVVGTTIDGAKFRLDSPPGRWVLVNFFATWCVPCRREHPELIRFQERHQAVGDVEVVGVVYDDSVEAVRQFRAERGGRWPMLSDPGGKVALDFGVSGVPESFLIGPDGVIVAKLVGGVRANDLDLLLRQANTSQPQKGRT